MLLWAIWGTTRLGDSSATPSSVSTNFVESMNDCFTYYIREKDDENILCLMEANFIRVFIDTGQSDIDTDLAAHNDMH